MPSPPSDTNVGRMHDVFMMTHHRLGTWWPAWRIGSKSCAPDDAAACAILALFMPSRVDRVPWLEEDDMMQ
jgi:hypothetical protein